MADDSHEWKASEKLVLTRVLSKNCSGGEVNRTCLHDGTEDICGGVRLIWPAARIDAVGAQVPATFVRVQDPLGHRLSQL